MQYEDYFTNLSDTMTIEEKIAVIKENISKAANITKEIRSFKETSKYGIELNSEKNARGGGIPSASIANPDDEDLDLKELYNKISLLDISNLTDEAISTRISDIMKNISAITLNKIKLMLYKESIIYNKMLLESQSESEREELKKLIESIRVKIEFLDEEEELENEETLEDENKDNNIFFLLSNKGNIIALESIRKSVPKDYYQAFKKLILGLKTGKLKGLKRLHRQGYFELKDFKIRIIFDRLSDGNYIILDAFMKKFDTSLFYRNTLVGRRREYEKKKDFYISEHTKEEFIKEHEGHLAELLALLDSKTLEEGEKNDTKTI